MPTLPSHSITASRIEPRRSLWCSATTSPSCLPTRIVGSNAVMGSWKTMDMRSPRSARRSRSGIPTSSTPSNRIEPVTSACSGSRPMTASAVTDLPEPDCPMMPRRSVAPSANEMPSTATARLRPKRTVRSVTSSRLT